MSRNSIHDIKPSVKLRKSKGYESRRLEHDEDEYEEEEERAPRRSRSRSSREEEIYDNPYASEKRSGGGKAIWYVAAFCILFLIFALSFLFAGATVEVTPRVGNIELNEIVVAKKSPLDSKSLTFSMTSVEGEESVKISSTEKKYIEKKAVGTVRIFNENSTSAQKLLIDTRLVTPDGKIYKTDKAVSVPGQKLVNGKKVPGTVDVGVYSDLPGEEFNAPDLDFKIFGFKGSPKYETIYAKSVTEISGGFKGDSYDLSPEEEKTQTEALLKTLEENLLSKAKIEVPEGFVIYDTAVIFDAETPTTETKDGSPVLTQKAKLHALLFKKDNLTRNLVQKLVSDFDNNRVYLPNLEDISVELMSASEINPSTVDTVSLSIKGDTEVIWEIDEDKLKDALVGTKKRKFESVLSEFKNIDRAEYSLKPFWKNTLPSKTEQIEIVNTVTKK